MTDAPSVIAAAIYAADPHLWDWLEEMECTTTPQVLADAVIRELPELRRIDQVRQACVASLNVDRVPGEALTDRAWLADTILNVLNGAVDG